MKKKPSGKKYKWGIRKAGRSVTESYKGPTWARAGVTNPPQRFDFKRDAEYWAEILSEHSSMTFEPFPLKPPARTTTE